MSSFTNILLVNFDFPPNDGIGGRRWGKLAKQLAKNGFQVHVIKANAVEGSAQSTWATDVIHENIHVHSLPRTYPEIISHPKSGFLNKMRYQLAKKQLEASEAGTIYDISIGWNKVFRPCAEELIEKHKIKNVIATGAPWNLLVYASKLKEKYPFLNIIIDYRDPWLNARNYGMQGLSFDRKKAEEQKQKVVLENADVVLSPYGYLTKELQDYAMQGMQAQAKFEVLQHFYDEDDLRIEDSKGTNEKIVFVYGGDLYLELDKELEYLRSQIQYLKDFRKDLYEKIEFRIFSSNPDYTKFVGLEVVKMQKSIGKMIFQELNSADFHLILLSKSKRNDRTTKFFEYLPLRKPILVVAEEGEVSKFVRDNNLGMTLGEGDNSLERIIEKKMSSTLVFNTQFNYSEYSLQHATQQLIGYLK